jgi:hypothetical protein
MQLCFFETIQEVKTQVFGAHIQKNATKARYFFSNATKVAFCEHFGSE